MIRKMKMTTTRSQWWVWLDILLRHWVSSLFFTRHWVTYDATMSHLCLFDRSWKLTRFYVHGRHTLNMQHTWHDDSSLSHSFLTVATPFYNAFFFFLLLCLFRQKCHVSLLSRDLSLLREHPTKIYHSVVTLVPRSELHFLEERSASRSFEALKLPCFIHILFLFKPTRNPTDARSCQVLLQWCIYSTLKFMSKSIDDRFSWRKLHMSWKQSSDDKL